MKLTTMVLVILVVVATLASAPAADAQHIGLRIAIAPSQPQQPQPVNPILSFVTSPVTPAFAPSSHFTFGYPATPRAHARPHPRPIIIIQPTTVVYVPVPAPAPQALTRQLPEPGTLRAQVMTQWGTPVVTVLTHDAEALHYPGGVVISLRNGVVAR